jgi:hypothetical protein
MILKFVTNAIRTIVGICSIVLAVGALAFAIVWILGIMFGAILYSAIAIVLFIIAIVVIELISG